MYRIRRQESRRKEKAKSEMLHRRGAESAEKSAKGMKLDPGVKVRRRISFKSTNLIGSFQDDVKGKGRAAPTKTKRDAGCGVPFTIAMGNLD